MYKRHYKTFFLFAKIFILSLGASSFKNAYQCKHTDASKRVHSSTQKCIIAYTAFRILYNTPENIASIKQNCVRFGLFSFLFNYNSLQKGCLVIKNMELTDNICIVAFIVWMLYHKKDALTFYALSVACYIWFITNSYLF